MAIRNAPFTRFRLITLFVVVALSAAVFLGVDRWLDRRPIPWRDYSRTTLNQHKDDDRPIVVFLGAGWDVNSTYVRRVAFEDPSLKRLFRRRSVVAYYADLTAPSPDSMELLRRLGTRSTPTVAVYPNGTSEDPVVLQGIVSASQIMEALKPISSGIPNVEG
ncbi:thioredoxin family protein [Stieleria varia]|uniref:Thiol:disulfide interchange protein DsbD n=1 Tax=Stieleria varia TaxID=2528005 RepID=A0A5C6B225_9BACT|nr:thioredoxin family protein [Stieleria varia]TWU06365.1 Thiol:disulfide interchange protein DsbD [Stieleria varia]